MTYTRLLVAVDLSADAKHILARAISLASSPIGELHLIHVIEPVPASAGYELSPAFPIEWENILQQRAEDFLNKLAVESDKENIKTHVRSGSVKGEIFSLADEFDADLIVIGTHGRHGISLLLGSTATSVIHGTPCDVLAVRISENV